MISVRIIPPFVKSGAPFRIRITLSESGSVTLTLVANNTPRKFVIRGYNDGNPRSSVTLNLMGGVPHDREVSDWGTAPEGAPATMSGARPFGPPSSDTKPVRA